MTNEVGTTVVPVILLHHRLALALDHAGLKPGDMVRVLDVHRNTVSAYLSGRSTPSRAALALWALRCGVSFHWLLTGENPETGAIPPVTLCYPAHCLGWAA